MFEKYQSGLSYDVDTSIEKMSTLIIKNEKLLVSFNYLIKAERDCLSANFG